MEQIQHDSPERINYHALKDDRPLSLPDMIARFEAIEAWENPDITVDLSLLRMNEAQNIVVPDLGEFTLTDWSRRQLATLTGIRFDRWFENASDTEKAEEMNRRFARAACKVNVRTQKAFSSSIQTDGILRAFVSPSYVPISDSFVGNLVLSALHRSEGEFPLMRATITDVSTIYSIRVGHHPVPGGLGEVGDVHGIVQIVNSGVGYTSLRITLALMRLICKNGMTLPIGEATLLRRRHQGHIEMKLWEQISGGLMDIGDKLNRGIRALIDSRSVHVDDPRQAIEAVLRRSNLPKRMAEPLLVAYQREPHPSAFGVSQALTDSQAHDDMNLSPEERLQLEDAAGMYLQTVESLV